MNDSSISKVQAQANAAPVEVNSPLTEAEIGNLFKLVSTMATEYKPLIKKVIYVNEASKVLTEMVELFNSPRLSCGCVGSVWCLECRMKLSDILRRSGVKGI